jgi:hypothetical protein
VILGQRVTYSLGRCPAVSGVVVGARATRTTIWDTRTGQEWPGVQFQIRADNGRLFWTVTYPDRERAASLQQQGRPA